MNFKSQAPRCWHLNVPFGDNVHDPINPSGSLFVCGATFRAVTLSLTYHVKYNCLHPCRRSNNKTVSLDMVRKRCTVVGAHHKTGKRVRRDACKDRGTELEEKEEKVYKQCERVQEKRRRPPKKLLFEKSRKNGMNSLGSGRPRTND